MLHKNAFLFTALGLRIKHLREDKGIDQKAFAFDCDISRTQLHHIEKGEVNVRLETLFQITKELEISLSELLNGLEKY